MKTLLINQAFVSPDEPGHTRHYELGRHLLENGHDLTIVASNLNYQTGKATVKKRRLVVEQDIDGIRVLRTYVIPTLHRSFAWRIVTFVSFMFTSIIAALRAGQIDLVFGTSPPIFQALSAWIVAALRRKPFLLEMRDLWPEFAVDLGVLKNPILIKLSRWLELFLYARATHIVVNSPAYVEYLRGKGVPQDKISYIPYGTDVEMFNPDLDGSPLREELGLKDKFLVVYAGAMGMANDLTVVLHAAKRLQENTDIHFVFIGDGKERPNLQTLAEEMELTNVTFAGARPKHEMPQVLAAADACVAIVKDIPMFHMPYPNKVFDHMAAGRPTVLAIDGAIREVLEQANAGVFVNPGDSEAFANGVLRLYEEQDQTRAMRITARAYVCEHFDRRRCVAEFTAMMERVARRQ